MSQTLPLPPMPLRFMAEDDEKFLSIANINLELLVKNGLAPSNRLLDLGCGYGRLVYGLQNDQWFVGSYLGVDILGRHVSWCQENISSKLSRYQFKHLDIKNDRYNPKGQFSAVDWKFDFSNDSFDYVCLFSVFTHMHEKEIKAYLQEVFRVLEPGCLCLATFFLYDDDRLDKITSPGCGIQMAYQLNDHTWYHSKDDILFAIAFKSSVISKIAEDCGFLVKTINWGSWAGGQGSYQDYMVFEKQR